jgi:hypothetical protein
MAHTSEEEQIVCELCELVILSETTPFTFAPTYQIPENFSAIDHGIIAQAETFYPNSTTLAFYTRPPPSLY